MRLLAAIVLISAPAAAFAAGPDERIVEGEVVAASARWSGGSIVTESTIRTAEGTEVHVQQLGGTVDGIGMRVIHGAPALSRGDYVAVELVDAAVDRGGSRRSIRRLTTPQLRLPFVRTTNATAAELSWSKSCVFVTFDADGTTQVEGSAEFDILTNSLGQWQAAPAACTFMSFRINPERPNDVGLDGINTVKFREGRWCRPTDDGEICHDPAAAGLTTLFFINDASSSRNGEILDADIELNGVTFAISNDGVTLGDSSLCLADLANTSTHEFGHLLGLDHTCWDGRGQQPRDDQGNPVPSCFPEANLSAEILDATMYNFQDCDERKKQTLLQDDIDAICAIYPSAADPGDCSEVAIDGGGCCSVPPARDPTRGHIGSLAVLAALIFGFTAVFRTRRRRPGRSTSRE